MLRILSAALLSYLLALSLTAACFCQGLVGRPIPVDRFYLRIGFVGAPVSPRYGQSIDYWHDPVYSNFVTLGIRSFFVWRDLGLYRRSQPFCVVQPLCIVSLILLLMAFFTRRDYRKSMSFTVLGLILSLSTITYPVFIVSLWEAERSGCWLPDAEAQFVFSYLCCTFILSALSAKYRLFNECSVLLTALTSALGIVVMNFIPV